MAAHTYNKSKNLFVGCFPHISQSSLETAAILNQEPRLRTYYPAFFFFFFLSYPQRSLTPGLQTARTCTGFHQSAETLGRLVSLLQGLQGQGTEKCALRYQCLKSKLVLISLLKHFYNTSLQKHRPFASVGISSPPEKYKFFSRSL